MFVITYSEYKDNDIVYNHLCRKDLGMSVNETQIHDVIEMIYLNSGDISYVVEGKSHRVRKNSLIFTRPGDSHFLQFYNQDTYDRYDVLFDEKILSSDIYSKIPQGLDVINLEGYQTIAELFRKMETYCSYFEGDLLKTVLSHLIEEIFYNIIIVLDGSPKNIASDTYTVNPIVIKAVEYIENNLNYNFTLEQLCRELCVTEGYLRHLFISHLQISPKKYLITKRLILAQMAIRSGAKPTDIYLDCGFSDYSVFYRDYKKYFGYPPSEELNREIIREIEI